MQRILFGLILLILLYGCSDIDSGKINTNDDSRVNSKQEENNQNTSLLNIPDFLELSKKQTNEYKGNLQGVNKSDSSGPYIFNEYYGDTLSFQLFYLPKYVEKSIINFDSIKKAKDNDYRDFILIVFAYPMQNPDKMEDYHEDNVMYPVNVKYYARKNEKWQYISEQTVKDLTELSQFQIKCIYSALKKEK